MNRKTLSPAQQEIAVCAPARIALLSFGWLNVGFGILGMILPVMPTTVFMLIALWAFSKSSLGCHRWLFDHPTLGRGIRAKRVHGIIPVRAKVMPSV